MPELKFFRVFIQLYVDESIPVRHGRTHDQQALPVECRSFKNEITAVPDLQGKVPCTTIPARVTDLHNFTRIILDGDRISGSTLQVVKLYRFINAPQLDDIT